MEIRLRIVLFYTMNIEFDKDQKKNLVSDRPDRFKTLGDSQMLFSKTHIKRIKRENKQEQASLSVVFFCSDQLYCFRYRVIN
jgi:hypothetical protein